MATAGSLQLSHELGICRNHKCSIYFQNVKERGKLQLPGSSLSSLALRRNLWSTHLTRRVNKGYYPVPYRNNHFRCHSFLSPGHSLDISSVKNAAITLTRSYHNLQSSPLVLKLVPAVGIFVFAIWGLGPLMRQSRNFFLHLQNDSNWKKSCTYHVMTSYLQPILLWTGAILVCRALDPLVLPTEASQVVKTRLINFVRSLSTVLSFAYCLSSVIQQAQKFFMETSESKDARNMGFQFAGKAVYSAVWVAAVSLFMELLGFSTQRWLTAGGLGTVLLTLAGREIFTNFLSSAIIHATRPFIVNEWIQTKIEGYEVSGTVEHVGWWSPTVIRGEDREAVYIPNHKFTVNVVRNLTQKTHWRIKTHLAISHLDVAKINNIVADMRKVLAKNPQVEQQKLHRRVFLENVNPENQALLILVSCFVKTSHFEEYLCVKEAILLDLLRVIRHHRARLATPIRTVQKIFTDADLDNVPHVDSVFHGGAVANRPLLLIEPSYKINGEDKTKPQARSVRPNSEEDGKSTMRRTTDSQTVTKGGTSANDSESRETTSYSKAKEMPPHEVKGDEKAGQIPNDDVKESNKAAARPSLDPKPNHKINVTSTSKSVAKTGSKLVESSSSDSKTLLDNSKQPKVGQENSLVGSAVDSSGSLPETRVEKPGSFTSHVQSKPDDGRLPAGQASSSKPTLEENLVLGVALEGSKRTLPIEEEMASPPNPSNEKELASCHSGNGPSMSGKGKRDGQDSNVPSPTANDHPKKQE